MAITSGKELNDFYENGFPNMNKIISPEGEHVCATKEEICPLLEERLFDDLCIMDDRFLIDIVDRVFSEFKDAKIPDGFRLHLLSKLTPLTSTMTTPLNRSGTGYLVPCKNCVHKANTGN